MISYLICNQLTYKLEHCDRIIISFANNNSAGDGFFYYYSIIYSHWPKYDQPFNLHNIAVSLFVLNMNAACKKDPIHNNIFFCEGCSNILKIINSQTIYLNKFEKMKHFFKCVWITANSLVKNIPLFSLLYTLAWWKIKWGLLY